MVNNVDPLSLLHILVSQIWPKQSLIPTRSFFVTWFGFMRRYHDLLVTLIFFKIDYF